MPQTKSTNMNTKKGKTDLEKGKNKNQLVSPVVDQVSPRPIIEKSARSSPVLIEKKESPSGGKSTNPNTDIVVLSEEGLHSPDKRPGSSLIRNFEQEVSKQGNLIRIYCFIVGIVLVIVTPVAFYFLFYKDTTDSKSNMNGGITKSPRLDQRANNSQDGSPFPDLSGAEQRMQQQRSPFVNGSEQNPMIGSDKGRSASKVRVMVRPRRDKLFFVGPPPYRPVLITDYTHSPDFNFFLKYANRSSLGNNGWRGDLCGAPDPRYVPALSRGTCFSKSKKNARIMGGDTAKPHSWPWMVLIMERNFNATTKRWELDLTCGGSVINERWILSAAHCFVTVDGIKMHRRQVELIIGAHENIPRSWSSGIDASAKDAWIRNGGAQHAEGRGSSSSREDGSENRTAVIDATVTAIFTHRGFEHENFHNDIALLKLDKPLKFSSTIRPICLPHKADGKYPNYQTNKYRGVETGFCVVAGWGSVRYNKVLIPVSQMSESSKKAANSPSKTPLKSTGKTTILGNGNIPGTDYASHLKEACISLLDGKSCRTFYKDMRIIGSQFCAGSLEGRLDSCLGDSGGPLMCATQLYDATDPKSNPTLFWVLKGIISSGFGCGEAIFPGLYTSVEHHMDWIHQIMKNK